MTLLSKWWIDLKVYKEPTWQLESTGVEGNASMFGVNIFDYEWINKDKRARIESSLDGSFVFLPIYAVDIRELLYESVRRKPIVHTLWMLNRIINDVHGDEKEKYIDLIKETANNTDLPDDVRDEAQFYLD